VLEKNGKVFPLVKAWGVTLKDHLLIRIVHVGKSVFGKYPRKLALKEFWLSQKMIVASILMTPYAFAKRIGILKEEKI
jgi:hypothetical protein